MEQFSYKIKDKDGVHARPAAVIIKAAGGFSSKLTLESKNRSINLKGGIFALMGLGIRCGDEVTVKAEGDDEKAALDSLLKAFEDNL